MDYRGEWRALDALEPLERLDAFDDLDGLEDFGGWGLARQTSV